MPADVISLIDLSAWADVKDEDGFAVMTCYFDGGNESDRKQYKTLTLSVVAGVKAQWLNFETRWGRMLAKHGAPYIHTTDLLANEQVRPEPFTLARGWTDKKIHALMADAAEVIDECRATLKIQGRLQGLMPLSVTIVLDDFWRVLQKCPQLRTPELHCTLVCIRLCLYWCEHSNVRRLQFIFDRGEPFRGHAVDQWSSKKVRKEEPIWNDVKGITEADHRDVPGLQAADMIAWCLGSRHTIGVKFEWQARILAALDPEEAVLLDYKRLSDPNIDVLNLLDKWKLPQRKAFR